MDIIQRINQNMLMDESFDIFVDETEGGFMHLSQKEYFEIVYRPYIPPIFLEQKNMKKIVEKCMNILRASHNECEICSQMLCGCVMSLLENYKTDICNMFDFDDNE